MDYNTKVIGRINKYIRFHFIIPKMKKKLINRNFTILCNNCIGGIIYHDFDLQFKSPTINMFFHSLDFLEYIEHFEYYQNLPLVKIDNPGYLDNASDYPVAVLKGNQEFKDLELHFLHYHSFKEAESAWKKRTKRIEQKKIFVIFSFVGMPFDKELYERCEALPFKNKVFFVNHSVDTDVFPHFYYIKGFENQTGLGNIMTYMNIKGQRFYDQYDFVKWFNEGV